MNNRFLYILTAVAVAHALFIFLAVRNGTAPKAAQFLAKGKLVAQTIQLDVKPPSHPASKTDAKKDAQTGSQLSKNPDKQTVNSEPKKIAALAPEKKPSPKKMPPKEADKKETPKKADRDPYVKAPEKESQATKELVSKVKESIGKIDGNRGKIALAKVGSEVEFNGAELQGQVAGEDAGYLDELASRMRLMLQLPDFGEVKVKLTLDRGGGVVKVEITGSASDTNRKYIEKKLPSLSFPPFGHNFASFTTYTFSLVLRNEI